MKLRTILELGVGRVGDDLAEPEIADSALAGDLERRLDSLGLVVLIAGDGRPQHVAVVTAGQPAVARQDQEQRALDRIAPDQERMGELVGGLAQVGDQLGDLARVGLGLGRPVQRLAEPVGGDQLHRPGDLADVVDRLAAFDDRAGLGHVCSVPSWLPDFSSIDRLCRLSSTDCQSVLGDGSRFGGSLSGTAP